MLLEQTPNWLVSMFEDKGWSSAIDTYYDRELQRFSVRTDARYVNTSYGKTHVLTAGRADAPPLVLLHGRGVNATVWRDYIADHADTHRIYAIDVNGEGGKSAPQHPFTWGIGYAAWLVEVFKQLRVEKAQVVGMSFGGWLALKLAAHAPQRVASLSLLAPAGFVWAGLDFVRRGMHAALFPQAERTRRFIEFLSSPDAQISEDDCHLLHMLFSHHHTNPEPPPPFSDACLRRLTMPTQIIIGAEDHVFAAQPVVTRAQRVLPNLAQATILPGLNHDLLSERGRAARERVREFVGV
ncbi:MAG: alpha/beta fold hydrolase [Chloroflexota bacterium]|nr:alpha/beta fold hydrolase [Chloroflexota bacterium]